jgi:hypothetical protein
VPERERAFHRAAGESISLFTIYCALIYVGFLAVGVFYSHRIVTSF